MQIKKISTEKLIELDKLSRPNNFDDFIWQEHIKKVLKAAIQSAKQRNSNIWHILFSWESWYWKTSLAQVISKNFWVNIKIVTWYAITKPSEIISILNSLQDWDILFIDEIHRIRPNIEEVLYIAMEDYAIDMVMPEWWNVRIPLNKFSLIWATTRLEALSQPLKNRFIYKFHFEDYTEIEKKDIIRKYINLYSIKIDEKIINKISDNIISVPREIHNFCIKLRDYLISKWKDESNLHMDDVSWEEFKDWANLINGWLNHIHKKYIEILEEFNWWPVWLKTISLRLWLNEKAVEDDIEPLLLKLWMIEKNSRWRSLK
jgi:Holliday junction DNA helicase RuvB